MDLVATEATLHDFLTPAYLLGCSAQSREESRRFCLFQKVLQKISFN
jgi:hypothetical protein